MKHFVIINGPNLNLLGKRETDMYGTVSFDVLMNQLKDKYPDVQFTYLQHNVEGDLVSAIQKYGFDCDGIILNPAAYTHTSVAIGDAVAAVTAPVIEVHLTNIANRESFRQISFVAPYCVGTITGLGLRGYELATEFLLRGAEL
jgi:3-dehydroquinate dehydratase-2